MTRKHQRIGKQHTTNKAKSHWNSMGANNKEES